MSAAISDQPSDRAARFVRRYYALRFFDDLALVYPVYLIIFLRAGLSLGEIGVLLALWCASVVVTEVPTGMLADRFNRRNLLVAAMLCKGAGFACWLGADGFGWFALGFLLWGLQESLTSGTAQSLVWDVLRCHGQSERYAHVASRAGFYAKLATALAFVAGGGLAVISIPLVLLCSVLAMLIGALLAAGLSEVRSTAAAAGRTSYWASLRAAGSEALGRPRLRRLLIFSMLGLVWANVDEFDQAYRDLVGMPLYAFGIWNVAVMGGQALGARCAERLAGRGRRVKYLCAGLSGTTLLLAAAIPHPIMLPVYAVSLVVSAVIEVLVDTELQQEISGEQRATVTSLNSLLMNLSAIAMVLVVGTLARVGGLPLGFGAVAIVVVVYAAGGWLVERARQ
jgi:MFS family permease